MNATAIQVYKICRQLEGRALPGLLWTGQVNDAVCWQSHQMGENSDGVKPTYELLVEYMGGLDSMDLTIDSAVHLKLLIKEVEQWKKRVARSPFYLY